MSVYRLAAAVMVTHRAREAQAEQSPKQRAQAELPAQRVKAVQAALTRSPRARDTLAARPRVQVVLAAL